jgi:glutamate dehydrogenase/leucine dehydrogenase
MTATKAMKTKRISWSGCQPMVFKTFVLVEQTDEFKVPRLNGYRTVYRSRTGGAAGGVGFLRQVSRRACVLRFPVQNVYS